MHFTLARFFDHPCDLPKVRLNCTEAWSETCEALQSHGKRFAVTVNAYDARVRRRFENPLAVSAQPERAINEKPASRSPEQFDCLPEQHGAMGRAHAPHKRSHHHRPVISFKELLNPESRNRSLVLFRIRI